MIDYSTKIKEIRAFTKENVKKSRYEHSVRVAEMSQMLCEKFKMNPQKGYLMGIAHDMCKDFSEDNLIELASKDGQPIAEMEKEKPALLHGRAAAILIEERFGIEDKEIREAIANHTSGIDGMCDYTKVLYLADKIEPGREHISEAERKELLRLPLDAMAYKVINDNYKYMIKKGYKIYPSTERMISELKKKLNLE